MGCSSSAQTRSRDSGRPAPKSPGANGLQPCELTPDESTPVADENETIPDQTKLDPIQDVDVTSEESKTNGSFPAEATEALVPAPPKNDSGSEGVDPGSGESTGPTPEGLVEDAGQLCTSLEEGTDLLPAGATEVIELSPAPPAEGIGSLLRVPAEDTGLLHVGPVEGNLSPVIEITKEVQINEEDQLIEGNIGALANLGGQSLSSEICVQFPLTSIKGCRRAEFNPQSSYKGVYGMVWLAKPQTQKSKL
ncbi:PREDICTED: glutamate-rich protein 5 isoform X1 [Gavialis gangeticus]|uniref:glutamate-rich protein 5 isoform X1 n=1 Tax=Gavialis gangeticus TaxID=94835 RepID=UPI00092E3537|nr:PREDICTED: glutamate-rich protein 5 isoform X1 [Gavialis gangeticus]